jgi:putative ATPase
LQRKRSFEEVAQPVNEENKLVKEEVVDEPSMEKPKINAFQKAVPLAERMRPRTLDDVYGQDLAGPHGVPRGLIEQERVPSMMLWEGAGTRKTTIPRCVASVVGSRFAEINSTSLGVAECKEDLCKAGGELGLTGRESIIFCDEIYRFSELQQDVFLGLAESG